MSIGSKKCPGHNYRRGDTSSADVEEATSDEEMGETYGEPGWVRKSKTYAFRFP